MTVPQPGLDTPASNYRVRSAETWAEARAAYLGGMSAEAVCARFDLGLRSLRMRAKAEGWRRMDQADPAPAFTPAFDVDELEALDRDPLLEAADLAALAWRRARRAVMQGALREALGWRRIHRDYLAIAVADARFELLEAADGPARDRPGVLAEVERDAEEKTRVSSFADCGSVQDWLAGINDDPPEHHAEETAAPSAAAPELHTLHGFHADLSPQRPAPSPTPAQARIRVRMEAWKARQAVRASEADAGP